MNEITLGSLWLPILLSGVAVFVVSSICWMVIGHHKSDWRKLPNEDAFLEAVRQQKAPPGLYNFPHCEMKEMKDPAALERLKRGPWGAATLVDGMPDMGRMLPMWFVHLLIVSLFVAYVASHALAPGAEFAKVFQLAGAAAFLGYAGGAVPKMIWEGKPGSIVVKDVLDGLAYALTTAAIFAWRWPTHG